MDVLKRSITGTEEKENGQPHGLSRWSLHSLKWPTQASERTTEAISRVGHSSKLMLKVILNRL